MAAKHYYLQQALVVAKGTVKNELHKHLAERVENCQRSSTKVYGQARSIPLPSCYGPIKASYHDRCDPHWHMNAKGQKSTEAAKMEFEVWVYDDHHDLELKDHGLASNHG